MTAARGQSVSLEMFLGLVGGDFVEVLHATAGLDIPIVAALIYDAAVPVQVNPGDLLLAIGMSPADESLDQALAAAAATGSAVVACKIRDDDERDILRTRAGRHDVTVIGIAPEMSWDQLYTLVRTSITTSAATPLDERGVPFGDMFALANSAAAMLEGPVIIDDERMEVIAFSSLGDDIDDLRRESILQRRPPREFIAWCESNGILPRVRQSMRPVRIVPPDGATRLVIAIKGGTDILGYLWVSEAKRKLDQNSEDLLAEVARVAALQLLRLRVSEDLDRRLRSDLFRSVLDGRGSVDTLAGRLGVGREQHFRVVGFDTPTGDSLDQLRARSVEDLIALRVEAAERRGAVTASHGRLYAVFPVADSGSPEQARQLAAEILGQSERQLHVALRAAVGGPLTGLRELGSSRHDVDRMLSLPVLDESARVVTFEDARSQTILAEITEILLERPWLLQGGIAGLVALDRDRGTDYLDTLRVFYDCAGDLTTAARKLFVHRNTLKYRLGRIKEISGIDLDDPTERLVAELQTGVFVRHPNPGDLLPKTGGVAGGSGNDDGGGRSGQG